MTDIELYLNGLSPDRKEKTSGVIEYIQSRYPYAKGSCDFTPKTKFPVFQNADQSNYIGIASQKNYITIHFGRPECAKIVAEADTRIKTGVGCANIPDRVPFPLEHIKKAADACFKNQMEGESMPKEMFKTIDEYISLYPKHVRERLLALRKAIREAAPEAEEKISWNMPTFALYGNLVHFAAHKNHIGFYPGANGIRIFADHIAGYKSSKGAVQFPLDQPLPLDLVREIVQYRIAENKRIAEEKKKKSK